MSDIESLGKERKDRKDPVLLRRPPLHVLLVLLSFDADAREVLLHSPKGFITLSYGARGIVSVRDLR